MADRHVSQNRVYGYWIIIVLYINGFCGLVHTEYIVINQNSYIFLQTFPQYCLFSDAVIVLFCSFLFLLCVCAVHFSVRKKTLYRSLDKPRAFGTNVKNKYCLNKIKILFIYITRSGYIFNEIYRDLEPSLNCVVQYGHTKFKLNRRFCLNSVRILDCAPSLLLFYS